VNSAKVESQIISLICYMITSARGLVDEPKIYGSSRLVEAARRLINLAGDCSVRHESLSEVARRIEEHRLEALLKGEEEFIRFTDDLVALLATWLRESKTVLGSSGEED
jgi:hypothetical protein